MVPLFSDIESAIFSKEYSPQISGCMVALYENERPLGGLIQRLDWLFHQSIAFYLKQGVLKGEKNTLNLIPLQCLDKTFWLFVVGMGVGTPGLRNIKLDLDAMEKIACNLNALKLEHVGVSSLDFLLEDIQSLQDRLVLPLVLFPDK